ncbi:hypothetical protein [Aquimarina agarivorans]|uniref:hypothetical protein n=1 Tax=Aquimarina agarivorans TaxID=980584 RepID=UPI000248E896|nr:hypothetical protein [Aquimarina agarivorans]
MLREEGYKITGNCKAVTGVKIPTSNSLEYIYNETYFDKKWLKLNENKQENEGIDFANYSIWKADFIQTNEKLPFTKETINTTLKSLNLKTKQIMDDYICIYLLAS